MNHLSEIIGSEKPILSSKEEGQFTYEELIYLEEDTSKYHVVGYLPEGDEQDQLFLNIYSKRA